MNAHNEPMMALAAAELPEGPRWQYEIKFDGYRMLGFAACPRELDAVMVRQTPFAEHARAAERNREEPSLFHLCMHGPAWTNGHPMAIDR